MQQVQVGGVRVVSGHVFRVDRQRGPVWYAKYRLSAGRQVQKKIGPAWCSCGRPPVGYFTKCEADAWLADLLAAEPACGVRFEEAAYEWLRYAEEDRACKPTTPRDYKNTIERRMFPWFGGMPLEELTPQLIEDWRASLPGGAHQEHALSVIYRDAFAVLDAIGWRRPDEPPATVDVPFTAGFVEQLRQRRYDLGHTNIDRLVSRDATNDQAEQARIDVASESYREAAIAIDRLP